MHHVDVSPTEQMEEYLDLLSEKVKRNVKIVTPVDVGQDYFLHISIDTTIKKFVPTIGNNQAPSEDRTVPRITVAPTLLGCFIGNGNATSHFLDLKATGKPEDRGYKGGWKIYAIPFKAALKPTGRLVYDSSHSNEHWLVAFSPEETEYVSEPVGKAFYKSITYHPRAGRDPVSDGTLYVEVTRPEGIRFSQHIFLAEGYWSIEGPTSQHASLLWSDRPFKATKIDKAEFMSVKNSAADLLGHAEPSYISW